MSDFTAKQGDTDPTWLDSLTYSDGSVVNLSGATVQFVMRLLNASTPTTNAVATIVAPSLGQVSYTPTAGDTATAGVYDATWTVTFSGGAVMTFPTQGYIEVSIEENITTAGGATIVSLGEAKEYLNLATTDRTRDVKLLRFIRQLAPVIEFIVGPVVQQLVTETYDGSGAFISLRKRPVISVQSVTEYRGPIPYPLTQVPTPDLGTIYSYEFQPPGRIVRRTVGGGVTDFPIGLDSVVVTYTAGYLTVPANITLGMLELIRFNYQETQQGRPRAGGGGMGEDVEPGQQVVGFFVPNKVREILQPNRRHASIA